MPYIVYCNYKGSNNHPDDQKKQKILVENSIPLSTNPPDWRGRHAKSRNLPKRVSATTRQVRRQQIPTTKAIF